MKVNIGCGASWSADGWVGLDYDGVSDVWADDKVAEVFNVNLKSYLPFEDESVQSFFSSHCLEHFSYFQGLMLLSECFRSLSIGGSLSLVVPDLDIYLERLAENDADFFNTPEIIGGHPTGNMIDNFLMLFYSDPAFMNTCHKYSYNKSNLKQMLEYIGFSQIKVVPFHEFNYEPELREKDFRSTMLHVEKISLCIECVKENDHSPFLSDKNMVKEVVYLNRASQGPDDLFQELQALKLAYRELRHERDELNHELSEKTEKVMTLLPFQEQVEILNKQRDESSRKINELIQECDSLKKQAAIREEKISAMGKKLFLITGRTVKTILRKIIRG